MKASIVLHMLVASLFLLGSGLLGATDPPEEKADIFPRWSLVGEWHVNHPEWTEDLLFQADGTFALKDKDTKSGTWVLTAEEGTPLLVLRWDRYATESLLMVSSEHFRGQTRPGRWIDMRRVAPKGTEGNAAPKR